MTLRFEVAYRRQGSAGCILQWDDTLGSVPGALIHL